MWVWGVRFMVVLFVISVLVVRLNDIGIEMIVCVCCNWSGDDRLNVVSLLSR